MKKSSKKLVSSILAKVAFILSLVTMPVFADRLECEKPVDKDGQQMTGRGNIELLDLPEVQVGRYGSEYRHVGSCSLTGPLKLYINGPLDHSVRHFIEVFAVDINGVRHHLSLEEESVVECNQGGALKIDFVLKPRSPRSKFWEKGWEHLKMRYYDNFNMKIGVGYERLEYFKIFL